MKIEEGDLQTIAQDVVAAHLNGKRISKTDIDGNIVKVFFDIERDGYVEDDYFSGTGAFVCTSVEVYIEKVVCDERELDFDLYTLMNLIEKGLLC